MQFGCRLPTSKPQRDVYTSHKSSKPHCSVNGGTSLFPRAREEKVRWYLFIAVYGRSDGPH